jgi:tyrosine-protein phosphatase OCA6
MPEMQDFFIENNIKTLHLNVDKMKEDNIPLTYNKTIMALQVKQDTSKRVAHTHLIFFQ